MVLVDGARHGTEEALDVEVDLLVAVALPVADTTGLNAVVGAPPAGAACRSGAVGEREDLLLGELVAERLDDRSRRAKALAQGQTLGRLSWKKLRDEGRR